MHLVNIQHPRNVVSRARPNPREGNTLEPREHFGLRHLTTALGTGLQGVSDTLQACPQCCRHLASLSPVLCLKPTTNLETFDDLHLADNSLKMDFEKIPCTSANARNHMGHIINNSCGYKPHLKMPV